MPLYEYECQDCKKVFEEIVSLNTSSGVSCKKCGSKNTKKLISAGINISHTADNSSSCRPRGGFS